MYIFIKILTGETIYLEVDPEETIETVKTKIESKTGVPATEQILVATCRCIEDCKSVADCGIQRDEIVHLLKRVPGGGSAYDCISDCPACPGKSCCEILRDRYWDDEYAVPENVSEDAWIALCDAFNISKEVRKIIKQNSESADVRCADVIHRLRHADPTLDSGTVEVYIK